MFNNRADYKKRSSTGWVDQTHGALKLLDRHHHGGELVVLGDGDGYESGCVDELTNVIFWPGRRDYLHIENRS